MKPEAEVQARKKLKALVEQYGLEIDVDGLTPSSVFETLRQFELGLLPEQIPPHP